MAQMEAEYEVALVKARIKGEEAVQREKDAFAKARGSMGSHFSGGPVSSTALPWTSAALHTTTLITPPPAPVLATGWAAGALPGGPLFNGSGGVLHSAALPGVLPVPKALARPRIPEPGDPVAQPCFDVFKATADFKAGARIGRHYLAGTKTVWLVGHDPAGAPRTDVEMHHESIAARHAEVTRQGIFMFLTDLGSNYGTIVDDQRLEPHMAVRLCTGANVRFGRSSRVFVFREPSALRLTMAGALQQASGGYGFAGGVVPVPDPDSPTVCEVEVPTTSVGGAYVQQSMARGRPRSRSRGSSRSAGRRKARKRRRSASRSSSGFSAMDRKFGAGEKDKKRRRPSSSSSSSSSSRPLRAEPAARRFGHQS